MIITLRRLLSHLSAVLAYIHRDAAVALFMPDVLVHAVRMHVFIFVSLSLIIYKLHKEKIKILKCQQLLQPSPAFMASTE